MTHEVGAGISRGRIAYRHDTDEEYRRTLENVDPNRVKDNVILIDDIQGRTIDEWINDTMQPVIDEYNSRQKRKDRKINCTYTEWHRNNGNYTQNAKSIEDIKMAIEVVFSYGGRDNIGGEYTSPETTPERKKEIYQQAVRLYSKWIEDFKEKYPHIKIGLAAIHADESTIHCHAVLLPQATYTRSLPVQCCWSRSLEQDGVEKIKDAELAKEKGGFQLSRLYKQFREHMAQDLIKEGGFIIKEEEHGKKHIPSNGYTELMQEATAEMEKAKNMVNFSKSIEQIQEEEMKIVHKKDNGVLFTTYKDSMLSKPRDVAIVPRDVYDSQESNANIKDIKYATQQAAERAERLCEQALNSMEQETNKALEAKVAYLEKEVYKEREEKIQLQKTVEKLSSKLSLALDFIRERGIFHLWERFRKLFEKEQELERKDREQ